MGVGGAASESEIGSIVKGADMEIFVASAEVRIDKRGSQYLAMTVRLRTEQGGDVQRMPAKAWAGNFDADNLPKAGFRYLANGELQIYNGAPQLIVNFFSRCLGEGPGDLTEVPAVDQQATYRRLYGCAWDDPQLSDLFSRIHDALGSTLRSGRSLLEILWEIPAGASFHHNRRAGLLQHVAEMVGLAGGFALSGVYVGTRWDVLEAGILLHDLGKVYEYNPDTYAFESTDVGERFGHTCWLPTFVASLVGPRAFQGKIADVLHCVLSHHGIEGGAPVPPKTPEAIMLNLLDQMSAKLDVCRSAQAAADRGEKPGFSPMLKATPICRVKFEEKSE